MLIYNIKQRIRKKPNDFNNDRGGVVVAVCRLTIPHGLGENSTNVQNQNQIQ